MFKTIVLTAAIAAAATGAATAGVQAITHSRLEQGCSDTSCAAA
jgi:hypothetical protein